MFNVYNIFAGWMAISFGERKEYYEGYAAPNNDVVHLSYLDFVKEELDNLFNLSNEKPQKEYIFDLEGDDLQVTTSYENNKIKIKMKYLCSDKGEYSYEFDYITFIKNYIEEMTPLEENYKKDFSYHEPDAEWNTEDWKQLLEKIKD